MNLGFIGDGAIARYARKQAIEHGHAVAVILLRRARVNSSDLQRQGITCVGSVMDIPDGIDHMIDCAGHEALQTHGADILRRGIDLTTVSLGALADDSLYEVLQLAATDGDATLHLASGAIGALDCLRAARVGGLDSVTYSGRKPPLSWKGSPAELKLDLDSLSSGAEIHFDGSARDAAMQYPKNANVAAAVALAGIGFDDTRVKLIADAGVTQNIHELEARGAFGQFKFEIHGHSLPENAKSSALAAMSVISKLEQESQRIVF